MAFRLAVLTSHPIQYQAPLFRALARRPEIRLHVFFCRHWGIKRYRDPGFGVSFSWDTPLLKGYNYTFLRNLNPFHGTNRFLGTINPGIAAELLRCNFDGLWIHGWALASNWIAWVAGASSRTPILLRGESNGLAEPVGLKGTFKKAVLNTFFSQISAFLAIGTNNANFYRSYGVPEEKIFWTPYAVDNDFWMDCARKQKGKKLVLRKQEGLPTDRPVVLFCGKFQAKKRPLDLLKAFRLIHDEPKATLVFVGDGQLRSQMEYCIAEQGLSNVVILGFRNQSELATYYALSDVLVLPSSSEPWGLVVNEAMCFGLPVIASDMVGAAVDLVHEGLNGYVYPVGNVEALAVCLRRILSDRKVREMMGRHSGEIIRSWAIDKDVGGVLQCLGQIKSRRL